MKVDHVTTLCRIIYVLLHLSRRTMDYKHKFRQQPQSAETTLRPTAEALKLAQAYRRCGLDKAYRVKTPEAVKQEAGIRVCQAGGDPKCGQLVLSESELQFGQYRVQTFKWLLENAAAMPAACWRPT